MPRDLGESRPTPEEILVHVTREEARARRGSHKIFLGYAAGVGKTYEMLNEANRRHQRGEDVVVGYVECHGRKATEEQIGALEVVPRKVINYRGATFEDMDTEAIVARHPAVVLVDELAHTNVPGSEREKRWQDVEVLLDAGIDVLSTMNVQHLESLNDVVHDITGVQIRETVPDSVLAGAEKVLVDVTPRALLNRLQRGDVYEAAKIDWALRNWFREGNLNALREIALREVAHEVDRDLADYRSLKHIHGTWATHDRVMVCVGSSPAAMRLVRRGWRIAQRLRGEITAVHVEERPPTDAEQKALSDCCALADRLDVPVITLHGDVASELIRYVRQQQITQVVVGHSRRTGFRRFARGSISDRLTSSLSDVDILVVAAPPQAG
jgi:two-component system, OmpR family, sensor histidine kinase KdpD